MTSRVAILSFHSHGDRSFLDDSDLALASGDLSAAGIENDLVLAAFGAGEAEDEATFQRLRAALEPHDVVVYERVWSVDLVARLRAALPGRIFVHCRGEHVLSDPPADWMAGADLRRSLLALVQYFRGRRGSPPPGTRERTADGWKDHDRPDLLPPAELRYAPNLRPLVLSPDSISPSRTISVQGNFGCPYQADARENPVYAGARIPDGMGRGCAFCTTGNRYDARPSAETAAWVLEQIRYVRRTAPERNRIVLKDQSPFGYLTRVVETLADEGVGPFTLMLETRADWLMRSESRFEAALEAAARGGFRLVPFLVGIENFSQPELDRYNKGTTAEANVAFLEWLWALRERFGETLDLGSASFGFVLFTPWTTLDDLEANHRAIVRTRFDRLRGKLLHSRARLYPDTALYYLAERDGVFAEAFREGEDTARRYGYFPARPWRYLHPEVERFAALATELVEKSGGKDEVAIFGALLEAFRGAPDPRSVTIADVEARRAGGRSAAPASTPDEGELRARFGRLLRPLSLEDPLAGGWRIGRLERAARAVRVELRAPAGGSIVLEISPRDGRESYARSRHYDIRHGDRALSDVERRAVDEVCRAIAQNDR